MTNAVKNLLALARAFGAALGVRDSSVSHKIVGKGDFFAKLQQGSIPKVDTYEKLLQKFSDHWPEGADWPADIPRPAPNPTPTEDAA